MTSLSGIRVPLPRNVSPVSTTSSCDLEMSVPTGLVAFLAKPFPFLWSSHLRFGCGLVRCSSSSSLGAGVVLGADGGAPGGDGERRQGGGVGERREAVLSSSHVDVVSSSSRCVLGLGMLMLRARLLPCALASHRCWCACTLPPTRIWPRSERKVRGYP